MILTVAEYRRFLKPLVLIVNAGWLALVNLILTERINAVEKMIDRTPKNTNPKQQYFQKLIAKYPSLRKFHDSSNYSTMAGAFNRLLKMEQLESQATKEP